VLLYLFIWRIVRTASRDLRAPQESFILSPSQAAGATPKPAPRAPAGKLVVISSPTLQRGGEHVVNSAPLTIGRDGASGLALGRDDYVSGRHARVEAKPDGVWIEDLGSTNGTFVNGDRLAKPQLLQPGDVVRIGHTDLRFEPARGADR
jgi:pSer/pThr/pTyr-binding forkhead associated (FHA) protein